MVGSPLIAIAHSQIAGSTLARKMQAARNMEFQGDDPRMSRLVVVLELCSGLRETLGARS